MLPKRYRLRRPADVRRVRQQGRGCRHPLAVLLVTNNDLDVSRFAFSASRGVGKAVVRNRVKRLLREAVRGQLDDIPAGWDCLLIARKQMADAPFAEVETAVVDLFRRADLSEAAAATRRSAPVAAPQSTCVGPQSKMK